MDITDMTPKKYAAEQAKRILRVNQHAPIHEVRPAASKLSDRARKIMSVPVQEKYALPRLEGAAGSRQYPDMDKLYDGAELKPFDGRPGSMDAFALPSFGDRT